MASPPASFEPLTPVHGHAPEGSSESPPPAPRKGVKRPHAQAVVDNMRLEIARDDDPAFMYGPDLDVYLSAFDLGVKERIQLCRTYASYLASQERARRQNEEDF